MVLPFPTPAPSPIKNPALSPLGRNVSCCCRTKNKNLYSFSRIHHCKSSSTNKPKKHPTGWDQQASQPNSPWQHEEVFLYRVWVWLLYVLLIPISFPQCQELVDMNAAATNRFIFIVLKLSTAFQSYKTKMITALCKEAFFCQSHLAPITATSVRCEEQFYCLLDYANLGCIPFCFSLSPA